VAPTREQKAIARAELTIGKKLGVGGAQWSVSRTTGDGVGSPVAVVAVGTWAGYVVEEDPAQLGAAAPGSAVGAKLWYAVGTAATIAPTGSLLAGDVLTSVADPSIAFALAAPDLVVGYARYLARRTSPAGIAG
jgi:hypothetical protein